jgi:hypothetical protein
MATFISFKIGTRVRRTGTKTKCTTNPLEYGTVIEQDQDGGEKIKVKADQPPGWNKQDHRNFEIVTSTSFVTKGTRVRKLGTNPPKYGTVIEDQDGKGGIKVKADEPGVVWNTQKKADFEFGSWQPNNVFTCVKVSKCQSPKIKVNVRVNGKKWEDIQEHLGKLVRDGNLSTKYREFEGVERRNDYYLRNTTERSLSQSAQERDEAGKKLEVDHTYECQLLAFSILNAKSCTKTGGVLGQIDLSATRTNQPITVQNFLNPIFAVHNDETALKKGSGDAIEDCLNLRLLNSFVNKVKGSVVKKWINAAKQPGHEVESFGSLLQRGFEKNLNVRELGVDPGSLVTMFERELRDLEERFTAALEAGLAAADAGPPEKKNNAEHRAKLVRAGEVAEAVAEMFGALDLSR